MIEWLLFFQVLTGDGTALQQFGPFKTKSACQIAGKQMQKKAMGGSSWTCVANTEVPATK